MYIYIYIIHLQFYVQYDRLDVNNFLLPCAQRLYKPYDQDKSRLDMVFQKGRPMGEN